MVIIIARGRQSTTFQIIFSITFAIFKSYLRLRKIIIFCNNILVQDQVDIDPLY